MTESSNSSFLKKDQEEFVLPNRKNGEDLVFFNDRISSSLEAPKTLHLHDEDEEDNSNALKKQLEDELNARKDLEKRLSYQVRTFERTSPLSIIKLQLYANIRKSLSLLRSSRIS
jgi:hypothetical protein